MEYLFFCDSLSYLNFIEELDENMDPTLNINFYKLGYIFHNILHITTDFRLTKEAEFLLFKNLQEGFGKEFNKDSFLNKGLQKKFKDEIRYIEGLSNNSIVSEILKKRSCLSKPYIDNILSKNNDTEINRLVSNYIHLCCNRTFDYDFRKSEYIVYDIIYRYLKVKLFGRR